MKRKSAFIKFNIRKRAFLIFAVLFCNFITLNSSLNSFILEEVVKFDSLDDRWAVIIGISKYKDKNLNLEFADNDAKFFHNSLINKCRFKNEQIKLLLNENATYENIRKNIDGWLFKNSKKIDKVIIFFSGHGTQDLDNNKDKRDGYDEFLVPYDFDDNDISSAIRDDVFAYWINNLRSENILLIFDSCYSGGAARAKGFNHIKIKGEIKVDSFVKDIFKELPKEGVALIGACKDNQFSYEADEYKMGVFTYFLIESLNKKSDRNLDNKLTIDEIFQDLKPDVLKYSKKKFNREQEPILISTFKYPFELVYLPIEIKKSSDTNNKEIENIIKQSIFSHDIRRKILLLEEAIKINPMHSQARLYLADAYLKYKIYDEALYNYEILLSLNKNIYSKYFIYKKISYLFEEKGEIEKAIIYIRKAIEQKKEDYDYYNQLASLLNKNSELDEAIKTYLISLNMNNRQREAYFELGRIFIKQEKYDEAISIIEKGININPDYYENYYLKGLLYKYVKKDEKIGNALIEKFHKMDNYVNVMFLNSDLFLKEEKIRNIIIKSAERSIKSDEFFIEPYVRLIKIYTELQKDFNKAKKYYEELIYQYPFLKNNKEINSLVKNIPSIQNNFEK